MERREFFKTTVAAGAVCAGYSPAVAAAESSCSVPVEPNYDHNYLQLRVGVELIRYFKPALHRRCAPIIEQIGELRAQLRRESVFMPWMRIRDQMSLREGQFRILWRDKVLVEMDLPCDPDQGVKNPARLLRWIEVAARLRAEAVEALA